METRAIAAALVRHARRMMPPSQAGWGTAMEQEAQHVEHHVALGWAFGCVLASYGERLRAEHYLLPLLARLYIACICIAYAVGHFAGAPYPQLLCHLFGQAPIVSLPFPFTVPFASAFTQGAHISPAASCYFMLPAPFWHSAARVTETALFLFAAWALIRNRASAFPAFVLAWLLIWLDTGFPLVLVALYNAALHHPSRHGMPHYIQGAQWGFGYELLFGVMYPLIIGSCIALLTGRHRGAPNPVA